jgi:hypothetical protein
VIKPTVGRIVWYRPSQAFDAGMTVHDWLQPLAATVAYVWSDTCVNLDVVDHNGVHHARTSVTLHQGEGPCTSSPFAEWMPYQKSVASGKVAPTLHAESGRADAEKVHQLQGGEAAR